MEASERWQEVKDILYPALEMGAAERSSFLDEKCGNDDELRLEIESLIAAHGRAGERFESPAVEVMAAVVSGERADGMLGRSLGPYEIIEKLGAGGMGEVYLAQDTRLARRVALGSAFVLHTGQGTLTTVSAGSPCRFCFEPSKHPHYT